MTRMKGSIPTGESSGSDAIKELQQTIVDLNEQSSKQTERMLTLTTQNQTLTTQNQTLTKIVVVLTGLLLVGLGVQIYISIKS